ncbi:MAG: DNA replication/repair protein RecF [Chloroflexi bacterium]|nr:DNA replication/repair protein RecF [Chloroflexota bacterium]MCL5110881.1 DNA replication/repair protein RecF [Chloroflexota bacterium]
MHLSHLSLENFRNYSRLELDLPPGTAVVFGRNAQGKTNLLESIYYLATSKSFRASSDKEVINWLAQGEEPAYSRLVGLCQRAAGPAEIEIALRLERGELGGGEQLPSLSKRIRVNKVARRAIDLIGQMTVVNFSPQDIEIVDGAPQLRRRYLDVTISQVDSEYCRTLAHYNKVVLQRNHLLRQMRDRRAKGDQLEFWDEEMAKDGAFIAQERRRATEELNELAGEFHRRLTGTAERLRLTYRPGFAWKPALESVTDVMSSPAAALARSLREQMRRLQAREVAQGVSLLGPHRDDLAFVIDQASVTLYGSRGQQRTVALSLKLAESAYLQRHTGEKPILLLDDVLSELDQERRDFVVETIKDGQQVVLTGTELRAVPRALLAEATLLEIAKGAVYERVQP